jgi:hypothetical protein
MPDYLKVTPENFISRLEAISKHDGVPYGRVHLLNDEEAEYARAIQQYKGYIALSASFKSFFLETIELCNIEYRSRPMPPLPESYPLFLPRLVQNFQSLCGAETVAVHGYPYQAYTILRNTFDNVVLTSAALQGIADFYSIDGLRAGELVDMKTARKIRKAHEFTVRKRMTGDLSGLSKVALTSLSNLDWMFDYETHGGLLSLTHALGWMRGVAPLRVLPEFEESAFALFLNRFCEIAWMTHRLIPAIQPPAVPLSEIWREKWRVIDESFELMVISPTKQFGKRFGEVLVEFVRAKFPFTEKSYFPLDAPVSESQ